MLHRNLTVPTDKLGPKKKATDSNIFSLFFSMKTCMLQVQTVTVNKYLVPKHILLWRQKSKAHIFWAKKKKSWHLGSWNIKYRVFSQNFFKGTYASFGPYFRGHMGFFQGLIVWILQKILQTLRDISVSLRWRFRGYQSQKGAKSAFLMDKVNPANMVKYPKISYTKVSDKMTYANSADPDQTAPLEAVWSESKLFAIPLSILRNNIKSKIMVKNVRNKVFKILGHLL